MPYNKPSYAIFLALALPVTFAACGGTAGQPGGGAGGTDTGATGGAGSTTSMVTGGTTSTQSGTPSMATAQSYCEGKIAREQKCDPANAGTVQSCLADAGSGCLFSGVRPEVRDALVSCLNDRPCGTGDDACFYNAGLANPAAGQDKFLATCKGLLVQCSSFKDDYCSATTATAEAYTTLNACLEKPCAEIGPCLLAAFKAICPGK